MTKEEQLEKRKPSDKAYREKHRAEIIIRDKAYRKNHAFVVARNSAKRRGIYWGLTLNQYEILVSNPCKYCWRKLPTTGIRLDRIFNDDKLVGYMIGNVVQCCSRCNTTRMHNFTYEEMLNIMAPQIREVDRLRELSGIDNLHQMNYDWTNELTLF